MKRMFLLCALVMCFSFAAFAQEADGNKVYGETDEGLVVLKSNDGNFQLELDGRMQLAAAVYSGHVNPMGNGTEVRRARLALKPTWKSWTAQFDLDFKDNEVEIKDMWIAFTGLKNWQFKFGNHKGQWSMEEVTSSRYITFMERGYPNAFAPDRRLGVSAMTWRKHWRVFAGLFGQLAGDVDSTGENEALGYNFRLTAAPLLTDNAFVHLGFAYGHTTPSAGSGDTVKFNSRPESHVTMNKFLTTGKIKNVDNWNQYGLEFAAAAGPVQLQGEYTWVDVNRNSGKPNASFNGYYAFVSWFVTGEKRTYNSEEAEAAGRVIPKKKGLGTFELAARISCLDLNDAAALILGGKGNNLTLAGNWYPYPNLKFSVNYILVNNDQNATGGGSLIGNDDFNVLQFGLMFLF